MKFFINDPKDGTPSVSLTILMISFVFACTAAGLHLANITQSTSTCTELFYSCAALYFGRRLTFNGKDYSSQDASKLATTISSTVTKTVKEEDAD